MIKQTLHCALVILADGFDEVEAVGVLSTLREAGLCVKSLGVVDGVLEGEHGIFVLPDATLVDYRQSVKAWSLDLLVLPGDRGHVNRLRRDPRIHELLRQVVAEGGLVAMRKHTQHLAKDALGHEAFLARRTQLAIWDPMFQPLASFVLDLIQRMEPILRP